MTWSTRWSRRCTINAADFGKVFPPLRLFDKNAMAQVIAGVAYHPGAIKYYKEIGQWPPKEQ